MPPLVLVLGGMVIGFGFSLPIFGFSLPMMGRQRLEEIFRQGLGNTAIRRTDILARRSPGQFSGIS